MRPTDAIALAVAVLLAAWVVRRQAWRAVLFLWPSRMRVEADAPADQMKVPAVLGPTAAELLKLDFGPLGTHLEEPPLGRPLLSFDYLHRSLPIVATMYLGRRGQPRLYLLTCLDEGGFVITADHRRPGRDGQHYISGGLDGATPERLLRAHARRTEPFTARALTSMEERVEAARAWFAGHGRSEVRQQNVLGLLWTLGSLGMVAAVFKEVWR